MKAHVIGFGLCDEQDFLGTLDFRIVIPLFFLVMLVESGSDTVDS